MAHPELMLIFFVIAFVYASVGFGGGSSYLAILAVYGLPFLDIRFIALACNIIVVAGSIIVYHRNHQINWRKILPLAAASVPMAYLGAFVWHFPVYLVYLCAMSEEATKWVLGLRRYLSRRWINNLTVQVEGLGAAAEIDPG